ncbi:MAG: monofunctional biosynthetic peptidoglycan transglycosylase [Sphingobacteriales bacterium]|nr:MAG: monofunctional biosynthetic peptidoglycan transglycosylase [Sphingobacteriales bacterium]
MAKKKRGKSILGRIIRGILALFMLSLVYLVLCKWIWPPFTLTQAGSLFSGQGLKRDYVRWDEMSPNIRLAAIASEDQLFPTHNGFDWKAIEKSIEEKPAGTRRKKTKRPRGAAASTITQQTAKNVFLWQGSGWTRYLRKAPEAFYTMLIEWIWGKERILEVYLNVIETGPGIFGVEAAARNYFNKPASALSRQEAAMIIACLPNPKRFTVRPVSRRVKWRTPGIVRQMRLIESHPEVRALIYRRL